MRKQIIFFSLLFLSLSALASEEGREERMLAHARFCIVNDLIASYLEGQNISKPEISCRAAELGISFIGDKSSKAALTELVSLRRFVLDAAIGETFTCYALSKGARIAPFLNNMDFKSERKRCESELASYLQNLGLSQENVPADAICMDPKLAKQSVDDLLKSIAKHRRCGVNDW